MTLPQTDVPFVPGTQEQVRDAFLADYRLEMIRTTGQDPAVTPGTEVFAFATMIAGGAMLQFSNINLARPAITPLNAKGQDLENWRLTLGLPEVKPAPSTGKIAISIPGEGSGTLLDGQPVQLPNGLKAHVVGNWVSIADGSEVDVLTDDAGTKTRFAGGTPVTLVAPPSIFSSSAKVSNAVPLSGGIDAETDERKLLRIENTLANKPGAGNWAQLREIVLDALASVQDCYVYPALGGPSSMKIVPVMDFDPDLRLFTRAPSTAALKIVRDAIYAQVGESVETVIVAATEQVVDVALAVALPPSVLWGGKASAPGWLDMPAAPLVSPAPWPAIGGGETRVTVTSVTSTTEIIVSAATAVAPIAGQTHIMWWSPLDMRFGVFLVVAVGGTPGAWDLTVERPMVSDNGTPITAGDYISPAVVNADAYGTSWLDAMRTLGPGENTADANRIPRALRHPYVADEDPSSLTFLTLQAFKEGHDEISDIGWSFRSVTSPTTPAAVASPPQILVPRHLGIYSQS